MKKISLLIIILIIVGNYSCERDDICPDATPTTPRLIIDFLDATDSDIQKNVFDIVVVGGDDNAVLPGYYLTNTSNLILPLKTTDNTTEFTIISNAKENDNDTPDDTSDDFIEGNQDRIEINYSREQVYVSRACGFKTIFKNVTLTIVDDGDNWMLSRQPLTDNQSVEDETTAHFNISH
ncbi:DUF6452 family protein [uncultured Algibacter sp.]|uniref:DUF6452 family protein n=1 Tax=uncultured Algibacter sp. TaxID=298659 RepID=UPI0026021B6E|nr:DUF6452 family protein [uncultured Algibacter sp.]